MATVYEVITNRIIEQLEQGTAPWQKPWSARGEAGLPHNFATKKPYRGINVWMLMNTGYTSPAFLTFKQARDLGGNVRKGEKGFPVVFWKFGEVENKSTGEKKDYAMCRYYTVFNIAQCDDIQIPLATPPADVPEVPPIECCESIVANWANRPQIVHGSTGAFYSPALDRVSMPERNTFTEQEKYYSTLFHELTHSTGHKSRLDRAGVTGLTRFGDCDYSREELIAEMGAAFLSGFAGIENKTIDNSASYIAGWLKKLRNDPKLVITAAQHAQKACDLILGAPAFVPADKSDNPRGSDSPGPSCRGSAVGPVLNHIRGATRYAQTRTTHASNLWRMVYATRQTTLSRMRSVPA